MEVPHSKSSDAEHHKPPPPPPALAVESSDDLLRDIFHRLSPKTLARFKLVSKRWNSLISDPDLLRNRPTRPADGLVFPAHRILPFFIAPFDKSHANPKPLIFSCTQPFDSLAFLHGSNGLLLCSGRDKLNDLAQAYFVINPTTSKHTRLPDRPVESSNTKTLGMCLAFDPSESHRYKVVCLSGSELECKQLSVYSSETLSWRKIERTETTTPFPVGKLDIENGVYWNGSLHWIPKPGPADSDSVYLDPHRGMLRVFPSPPAHFSGRYLTHFGESCGHLHFVVHNQGSLDVYEMSRDYSGWFLKYTRGHVNFISPGVHSIYGFDMYIYGVSIHVLVRGDEDCFVIVRLLSKRTTTLQYNVVSGTWLASPDKTLYPWHYNGLPLPYFESMCPV